MVNVFWARDPTEAHLVKALLERHGIAAVVQGDASALATCSCTASSVWVEQAADTERAAYVIATEHGSSNPARCESCGYDLQGLPQPRCPECGTPFRRLEPGPPWVCPRCGEECEGQFAQCWHCGTDRPEEA